MIIEGVKIETWHEEQTMMTKVRITLPSGRSRVVDIPDQTDANRVTRITLAVADLRAAELEDEERYARA